MVSVKPLLPAAPGERCFIVYTDDAEHAQQSLAALRAASASVATHWIVVACPPRMTHRVSKWISHSSRENWRGKWADKLFTRLLPWLQADGRRVTPLLATVPLDALTAQIRAHVMHAEVVDARRPRRSHADAGWAGSLGGLASMALVSLMVADG